MGLVSVRMESATYSRRLRAIRRHHRARVFRRRRHYWGYGSNLFPDDAFPSVIDTPKPCSCWKCGNPRRFRKHTLTIREIKFSLEAKAEIEDIGEAG